MVRQCPGPFATYTGSSVDVRTDLDYGMFYPISTSWTSGDRDITCYASRVDSQPMTASVRATSSR
jgi:hypothetical protein